MPEISARKWHLLTLFQTDSGCRRNKSVACTRPRPRKSAAAVLVPAALYAVQHRASCHRDKILRRSLPLFCFQMVQVPARVTPSRMAAASTASLRLLHLLRVILSLLCYAGVSIAGGGGGGLSAKSLALSGEACSGRGRRPPLRLWATEATPPA